jgi:hypothetical protein
MAVEGPEAIGLHPNRGPHCACAVGWSLGAATAWRAAEARLCCLARNDGPQGPAGEESRDRPLPASRARRRTRAAALRSDKPYRGRRGRPRFNRSQDTPATLATPIGSPQISGNARHPIRRQGSAGHRRDQGARCAAMPLSGRSPPSPRQGRGPRRAAQRVKERGQPITAGERRAPVKTKGRRSLFWLVAYSPAALVRLTRKRSRRR